VLKERDIEEIFSARTCMGALLARESVRESRRTRPKDTSAAHLAFSLHTAHLPTLLSSVVHSPLRIMSEKIQEFLEVPQEFIHEGNQVRHSAVAHPPSPSFPS
jgi:hypothetical protein